MGACLSCLPANRFFSNNNRRAPEGSDSSRSRRCFCFFPSCCGMYDALFQTSEEQDVTSAHSEPLVQSAGHSDGMSVLHSVSHTHSANANMRNVDRMSNVVLRQDKMGTTQIGETQYSNGSGSGLHRDARGTERAKVKDYNGDQKLRDKVSKLPPSSKNAKVDAITSLLDDEDICPTCLDGYEEENPKILTKCGHHFHLACIFEWMERSDRCPLCDQEMIFNESS